MLARLTLAAVLTLTVAACGGTDTAGPATNGPVEDAAPIETADPAAEVTEVPTEQSPADVGSRDNPVPIGTVVTVGDWDVAVVSVNPNAADVVAAENQFNDPPAEGFSFVMIGLKATYNGDDTGTFWVDVSDKILGNGGNTFDDSCGVIPNPAMDAGEVFPGAAIEANVCFAVETAQLPGAALILEPAFSFSDSDRKFFALE